MATLTRLVRLVAAACIVLVTAGWVLFAVAQTDAASKESAEEIAGQQAQAAPNPSPDQERARERVDGTVHEAIDDANDVLLRPFAPAVDGSGSQWVRRTVPALLALLVYGLGLSMLSRYLAMR